MDKDGDKSYDSDNNNEQSFLNEQTLFELNKLQQQFID